jgi:ATP-dependent DNA helicase RecG
LSAPVFESLPNGFQVTVYANVPETIDVGVNGGVNLETADVVNVDSKAIFSFIEKNPGVNVLLLMNHFEVPKRTVERWVKQLKGEHKIEFRGAPKTGGYWVVG